MMIQCDLRAAPIDGHDTTFDQCQLSRGTFTGCKFDATTFSGNLSGNLFSGCIIMRCNFAGSQLEGAQFSGTTYDLQTVWPEGYIPEDHGLRLADGEIERMRAQLDGIESHQAPS